MLYTRLGSLGPVARLCNKTAPGRVEEVARQGGWEQALCFQPSPAQSSRALEITRHRLGYNRLPETFLVKLAFRNASHPVHDWTCLANIIILYVRLASLIYSI
jgi:hypothetical protein